MIINFFKMQAQGNDYIYIDLNDNQEDSDYIVKKASDIAKRLSRRSFSVGGDGVVIISETTCADGKMSIYNSDGSLAKMCGNALRCVGWYLCKKLDKNRVNVLTESGIRTVVADYDFSCADMGSPVIENVCAEDVYGKKLVAKLKNAIGYKFVSVGNPHFVILCDKEKFVDIGLIAPLFNACNNIFEGINVEVCYIESGKVYVRVFERGSGETLCCGTGATAVYRTLCEYGFIAKLKTAINFIGGRVYCYCEGNKFFLSGKVTFVYKGQLNYD